jgi:hypothetical protein
MRIKPEYEIEARTELDVTVSYLMYGIADLIEMWLNVDKMPIDMAFERAFRVNPDLLDKEELSEVRAALYKYWEHGEAFEQARQEAIAKKQETHDEE